MLMCCGYSWDVGSFVLEGVKGEEESEKESEVKETAQDLPLTQCFCACSLQVGCIPNTPEISRVHECHCQVTRSATKNVPLQIESRWSFKTLSPPHERPKKAATIGTALMGVFRKMNSWTRRSWRRLRLKRKPKRCANLVGAEGLMVHVGRWRPCCFYCSCVNFLVICNYFPKWRNKCQQSNWIGKKSRMPRGFPRTLRGHCFFFPLSWLLNTKKGHNTCTFRTCLDPELSLSPFHVWGLQLVSWEVFAKLLLQEGVVANVPCSAAGRRSLVQLVKIRTSQNRKEELFMHFCAVLEVLRGHEGTWIAWVWWFPEIVIISQSSITGAVAMWSKNEKTKPEHRKAFMAFIEPFHGLPRSLVASTWHRF